MSGNLDRLDRRPELREHMLVSKHNRGRHPAPLPVIDALHRIRSGIEAEQTRKRTVAARRLDQRPGLDIVHTSITHHVYIERNMLCNNPRPLFRRIGS